jgi:hypothetical protein
VLFHGELHIKLPKGAAGTKLFSVDIAQFAATSSTLNSARNSETGT